MAGKTRSTGTRDVTELPDGPPDAHGLTPRQQRVLTVIRDSIDSDRMAEPRYSRT